MFETFGGNFTIKLILRDNWPRIFKKFKGKLRDSVVESVEKALACGDKDKMGYHLYECPNGCGEKKYVAHTCKSRFCNSCGKVLTDKWINNTCSSFLNVPHHHVVFNPPSELWYLFRFQSG